MTVGNVDAASQASATQRRADQWQRPGLHVGVGQQLELKVLRQLAPRKYLVAFGGERHIVETSMSLTSGRTIRTSVAAIGDKLELKYVGVSPTSEEAIAGESAENSSSDPGSTLITDLQNQHAVSLSDAQRAAIAHAMSTAPEPQLMVGGGLYLSKLSLPLDADALNALYLAQTWQSSAAVTVNPTSTVQRASVELAAATAVTSLATMLKRAVNVKTPAAPANVGDDTSALAAHTEGFPIATQDAAEHDSHPGSRKDDLAQQLLNEQDGGSVAYHYGTLPVLIADQLVELDLVYFRERQRTEHSSNLRRLVMTFKTESFGRVQIVAQALAEHLSVEFSSESAESNTALAAHSQDVMNLLERLGWNVDAVKYELQPNPRRAASHVIAHVLNAETLDCWV